MPSRKRDKGRARRAKKASAESKNNDDNHQQQQDRPATSQEQLQQLIDNLSLESNANCTHGYPALPADDICSKFMREFEFALCRAIQNAEELGSTYNSITDHLVETNVNAVCSDEDNKRKISAALVSLGTNYLLHVQGGTGRFMAEIVALHVIRNDCDDVRMFLSVGRDLCEDKDRELTRFFMKRIKCSCLKEKYKQVKSDPKMGRCLHCKQDKERKELLVCTGCMLAQYCSKACQRTHWPSHKDNCLVFKSELE